MSRSHRLRFTSLVRSASRNHRSRSSSPEREAGRRFRRGLEQLEDRRLLSGVPALTLTIAPATFAENAGAAAAIGTVTRVNTDNAAALTVNLATNNINQAVVPVNVVIPAGQNSTTFPIDAVDDHLITGTQTVAISAWADAAVPLSVATTFGSGGSVAQNSDTEAVAVQPDGKIVTIGVIPGGTVVSRYNADGTLDTTFGTNGAATTAFQGYAVLVQPDGKIVVGGTGSSGSQSDFELARLNPNGTLDAAFGNGGNVIFNQTGDYNEILDLALQSDGKILAGGGVSFGVQPSTYAVARLNPDGSLDTNFGNGGIASVVPTPGYQSLAYGIVVQPNGDIVLSGTTKGGNFDSKIAVARFTPSGLLDPTFGNGGLVLTDLPGWYDGGRQVALQPDGKLVVAGSTSPVGLFPPKYDSALVRYNPDGTLDSSFGNGGEVITDLGGSDGIGSVAVQPEGMILAAGGSTDASGQDHVVVARYMPNGTLESDIIPSASGLEGQDMALAPNGEIFVAGESLYTFTGQLMAFQTFAPLSASANVSVLESDSTSTITVNTLRDAAAASASTSPVDTNGNGEISLRSAIQYLDAHSGGSITFDPSLFANGPGTIPLTLGELAITKAITIDGPGASQLTVDAGGKSRLFFISGGTATNYVTISGLTLTGGDGIGTTNANYNEQGGAILNIGYLTLSHDGIQGNAAQFGGGIHNIHFMTSIGNTITDNRAEARSGSPYGASVYGGGIYNTGILTSLGDTISSNTAQGSGTASGGGISNGSDLILTNDTVSGNSAQGFNAVGGAIDNQIVLDLSNDTISGNTAVPTGGNNVGGVNNGSIGTLSLANSLLVGNTSIIGSASAESDLVGAPPADDNGHNLVNQSAVGILVTDASGNPVLSNNGGPTQTIALAANSPAIGAAGALATLSGALSDTATTATVDSTTFLAAGDALTIDDEIVVVTAVDMYTNTITISRAQDGTSAANHASGAALSLAYDQRGLPRHAAADIGAFEIQIVTPSVTVTDPSGAYTGSAYSVTAASVVGQGGTVLASLGDPSLSYSYYQGTLTAAQIASATPLPDAPTNVGDYTVVAHFTSDVAGYSNADSSPTSFSITPAKVSYTIGNDKQVYGSAAKLANDLGATIDTGVNGETLDITYASTGDTATANAGSYPITGTLSDGSGSLSNYSVTLNNGTLTVDPYAFTYTIGNDSQTYGSPADLAKDLGTTIDTGVNGQTLGITYASTGDTATANAGSYPITGTLSAGSGSLSNYSVTLNNGTLTVDPYAFTYTIGNDSQTYGSPADLAKDLGTTIDTGVNGQTLGITYASTGDTATANAGSYPITGTLSAGSGSLSNYSVTLNNGTLTVDPYAFTYTIGNDSQRYGSPADLAKDLGTTIDTGVNGQTLGITYASTGDTATANAGSYPITGTLSAGSGSLSNYSVTLKNGTLTVDPYAFTCTIGNDSQTYGSPADLAKDLGTTIDTGVNGQTLGITYASTGDTATANAGNYPITGTLSAGSGSLSNYSVTLKNGTLTVDPYAFTYTIGNDLQVEGFPANLAADLPATISGVNGETLNISYASTGDTVSAAPGAYPITGTLSSGTGTLANYSVTLNPGTLTVAGPGATAIGDVLYLIGGNTNDHVDVSPVGPSGTGSSGIQLDASLNGVRIHDQVYSQSFKTIYVVGFGGNDHIDFAPSLTIPTVVREGDGNDQVWLGNGNNTVTVGNGNDDIRVGDGNNVIVAGSGSDSIQAGNGDNLIVGGLGHSNVSAGNGNNILIDGSVSQSADQLWAVLDEWMAGDVADVQADLAAHVTYNTTKANSLQAGTGRDWFWENYAKDRINNKPGDLLN